MNPQGTVIVCGSREGLANIGLVERALSSFETDRFKLEHVVVGSTRGVDGDAMRWALKHERTVTVVCARWAEHGKAAGPARNERMFAMFKPHAVLAFPGGAGTASMRGIAEREWCPLWTCEVRGEHRDHWQWHQTRGGVLR